MNAAPAGVAATISSAALAHAATAGANLTFIKLMTMTKLKLGIIGALVVVSVVTPLAIQDKTEMRLRGELNHLRQQLDEQTQLAEKNRPLPASHLQASVANNDEHNELLRLRAEVTRLRAQAQESAIHETDATRLNAQQNLTPAAQLRQRLKEMPERSIPELQLLDQKHWDDDASRQDLRTEEGVRQALANLRRAAKVSAAYDFSDAIGKYLQASGGELPADVSQLKPYFDHMMDDSFWPRYQLTHPGGKIGELAGDEPLIVERGAVDNQFDSLLKINATGFTMQGVGQWSGQTLSNTWPNLAAASAVRN